MPQINLFPTPSLQLLMASLPHLSQAVTNLSRKNFSKRSARRSPDYELVFSGTGTGSDDCDAAIEGTAYLSLVSNATQVYDVMIILKNMIKLRPMVNSMYSPLMRLIRYWLL